MRFVALARNTGPWLTALVFSAPAVGCNVFDRALNVTAPDKIETAQLQKPENAALLVSGAIGDFECALGSFVAAGALASGELVESTATAARWSLDRRDIDPSETLYSQSTCEGMGTYTPLSTARFTADNALKLLQGWTDAQVAKRTDLIAQAAAYGGYSRLLLGEAFCAGAINQGPLLTSADFFASAESSFTTAIAAATTANNAAILNMAYVGRARARLDKGDKPGALADAQKVPPTFVLLATADLSNARRQNRVFAQNNGRAVSVAPSYRGVTVTGTTGTQPDPRVAVTDAGRAASDNRTPLFNQTKYPTGSAGIAIASGKEAQLIIAEIQGGATAAGIINDLRTRAGITTQFASADAAAIAAEVVEARRRELFLEGQRFYDVRRLNLPLLPAPGGTYSTVYAKGGTYGSERCFPLPNVERQTNPNIKP